MSLRERIRLEEIEGESLLNKPQWFTKEEVAVDAIILNDKTITEDTSTPLAE